MVLSDTILVLTLFFVSSTFSQTFFNTENVILLKPPDMINKYFGYTVLLQKGDVPIVTIGAPKESLVNGTSTRGEVIQCKVNDPTDCEKSFTSNDKFYTTNGNFFGAALDGDEHAHGSIMACAPRTSSKATNENNTIVYYIFGACFFRRNSLNIEDTNHEILFNKFKNLSLSRYAYGVLGFDISFFNKDEVLCGAPGVWRNGRTLSLALSKFEDTDERPAYEEMPTEIPKENKHETYFGYSVNAATNLKTNEVWYLTGTPRANMIGQALLYTHNSESPTKINILQEFEGNREFGSYFGGSVLMVNVTGDLDVIVGAPTTAGKTYEEGCVYYYKNAANTTYIRLTGSGKMGARFGTSIASLGDFDLDGFNDIAISAPYENNGEGAIYIYRGRSDVGFQNTYERLSPSKFKPVFTTTKGFGLGISKGNDINNDGHNDIAIGAYKTDQVFIVRSYGLIEHEVHLNASIKAIKEDTSNFDFQICIQYDKRSEQLQVGHVDFGLKINLDYRAASAESHQLTYLLIATLGKMTCSQNFPIVLKNGTIGDDIMPFTINVKLNVTTDTNIKSLGKNESKIEIHYAIGCKDETTCVTGLNLLVATKNTRIVLKKDRQIILEVAVSNDAAGDPAYKCLIRMQAPPSIQLRNINNNCDRHGENYICSLINKLKPNKNITATYIFDIINLELVKDVKDVEINISVSSYGVNREGYTNTRIVKIPVIPDITSYIVGNYDPDIIVLSRTSDDINDTQIIVHEFTVWKSDLDTTHTLKLNVTLFIPTIEYMGDKIFQVLNVKDNRDSDTKCSQVLTENPITADAFFNRIDNRHTPHNKTIFIYCDGKIACTQYRCTGGYLHGSKKKAVFEIKMKLSSNILIDKFNDDLRSRNVVVYTPIAVQHNTNNIQERVMALSQCLIYVQAEQGQSIPLWALIIAAFVGFMILFFIILIMYKYGFFEREYKELIKSAEERTPSENENPNLPPHDRVPMAVENGYVEFNNTKTFSNQKESLLPPFKEEEIDDVDQDYLDPILFEKNIRTPSENENPSLPPHNRVAMAAVENGYVKVNNANAFNKQMPRPPRDFEESVEEDIKCLEPTIKKNK